MIRVSLGCIGSLLLALLVLSCSGEGETARRGPEASFYVAAAGPDELVENFELAWRRMDAAAYDDLVLYDGALPAPDGEAYAEFLFYYRQPKDSPDHMSQTRAQELSIIRRLFSGTTGANNTPGVASIDFDLERVGDWELLEGSGEVYGDPYPIGTWRGQFTSWLKVALADTIPGSDDIDGLEVEGALELYLIPVITGAGSIEERREYRLWKWRDRTAG